MISKLPGFALADPWVTDHLTISDLYTHRSGLPDHAGDGLEDLGYNRAQVLEKLRQLPLNPFRITYEYTNFGVTAGAEAVAAAAGTDWETLSQNTIYGPLGMTSTSSRFADYQARENRTVGHILEDGKYKVGPVRDADAQSPAGGVSSSVNDMAKWLDMVLSGGRYQGSRSFRRMRSCPQSTRKSSRAMRRKSGGNVPASTATGSTFPTARQAV